MFPPVLLFSEVECQHTQKADGLILAQISAFCLGCCRYICPDKDPQLHFHPQCQRCCCARDFVVRCAHQRHKGGKEEKKGEEYFKIIKSRTFIGSPNKRVSQLVGIKKRPSPALRLILDQNNDQTGIIVKWSWNQTYCNTKPDSRGTNRQKTSEVLWGWKC